MFCGRLHTDALLSAPLGTTNAVGLVGRTLTGAWSAGFAGAPLTTQALAINGRNAYLSNGIFLCLPKAVGSAPFLVKRIYSTSSHTATTSTGAVTNSCQVTRYN